MNIITILKKVKSKLVETKEVSKLAILCALPHKRKKKEKVRTILWFGAYGNTNIGDNMVFFAIRKYLPKDVSILLSSRERHQNFDYGVTIFYFNDKRNWLRLMKGSQIVLLGGGGLFEYYRMSSGSGWLLRYLEPLVYARHLGKSYAIVGVGCNNMVIRNSVIRYIFRKVSNDTSFIITRDQKSREGFIKNGVDNQNLKFCFDPVFTYMPIEKEENRQLSKVVGFLVWPFYMWPHFHSVTDSIIIRSRMTKESILAHDRFLKELRACVNRLEGKGIKCVFPVFHFSDIILHRELGVRSEYNVPSFDDYLKTISKCDIIVTMRYHGQITSLLKGKPIISILVQEKMEALVDNLGLRDTMSVDIENLTAGSIEDMVDNVYEDYNNIVEKNSSKVINIQDYVNHTYINTINALIR